MEIQHNLIHPFAQALLLPNTEPLEYAAEDFL